MASSKVSNAGSSHQEQREQKVLDVMFLCDEWKSSKGGLSTFNREFAINLAQATTGNMKIHCYVSNSDDRDREDAKQHGVNLITAGSVPGSADPHECLKFPPSQLPNPYLVIGHGRKLGIPAYFLARSTKCKWIQFVHVYCEDLGKYKEPAKVGVDPIEENEKKHKMEIELCEAADAVVAVGSRLQWKYSRRLLNVEVKIITPGIFGKFSNESKLAVDRSVVKNFNVSLFGRAAFEDFSLKGYDVVADAIGSLGKNFELTFVGSSPGEHQKVEQWFLDNTCINKNQLTIRRYCSEQEELKMMFYQSDLVALPSRTEGFGLSALEAISAGVPVLVSDESGIAEALQKVEGGSTVIVGSGKGKDEWARRIREMCKESAEEREVNAVKLRENYRKVYSWKAECERFKGLIENVVKTANGASSSEFHSISSTSESLQNQEELKKWKQKTKIVETEKLKGMLPLPGSSTSDPEKELEEQQMKLQRMEGSSSPPLLSTTDLEEKLGRVCVNLNMLRMEGGFPVLQFSTVDLDEKLDELYMEFQRLRMEGTLPPPQLFTTDLEDELKGLCSELNRVRMKGSSHPLVSTIEVELGELLKQLQKWRKEGTTRKELAPPENVIQSISFRSTSDVEDIVIQFMEALQLEPASLISPEPETKSMIRGLAFRAKSEKQYDLVRHLREITPAGTTGPLLNEDMSVGCMPHKQYKDLTFSLSAQGRWKRLAERLGFSQIEMCFLDERVVNPSHFVLGAVAKHRHLSVGEIYDTLVDCGLPVIADLM